jgi:hypothetical protein
MKVKLTKEYFEGLRGKLFKLLPLKEGNDLELQKYINSLLRKLTGAYDIYEDIDELVEYYDILNMVGYMANHDFSVEECRADMFEMQSLIDKIITRLDGDKGD